MEKGSPTSTFNLRRTIDHKILGRQVRQQAEVASGPCRHDNTNKATTPIVNQVGEVRFIFFLCLILEVICLLVEWQIWMAMFHYYHHK